MIMIVCDKCKELIEIGTNFCYLQEVDTGVINIGLHLNNKIKLHIDSPAFHLGCIEKMTIAELLYIWGDLK